MIARRLAAFALACAWAGTASAGANGFDTELVRQTLAAGLDFAAPRTLDPTSPGELATWGLGGISALDPGIAASIAGNEVRLSVLGKVVLRRPKPANEDGGAWAALAAEFEAASHAASAVLRQGGQQALIQSFFDEMFNHLDPYSRYVPPGPAEEERDKLSVDATAGLSAALSLGHVTVSDVVPGGPAEAAGVHVGDQIIAIAGRTVTARMISRVPLLLSGEDGETVALRLRAPRGQERRVTVTLGLVPPETVFASSSGDIETIRLEAFVADTSERLARAIDAAIASPHPPKAIVLDLRGNRGGLLRQAVTSVALFAESGMVASTQGRAPNASHEWRIEGGDLTHGLPLIVLVDGRTASAAEVMAAALADFGRAVVVGSTTLGKGLVQTLAKLPDGGELFITWSRLLAPRGWPLQTLGVMPQLCTSRGEQALEDELTSLAAGQAPMAAAVAASRAARPPLALAGALKLREPCPAAEGEDGPDFTAARFLAEHPAAYQAALLK